MMKQHIKYAILALIFACINSVVTAQGYRVQPGDSLAIEVLEDASLNRSVLVLPDGRINFPFTGSVTVAGRSATEIERAISKAISPNFAATPTVFVSISPSSENFDAARSTVDVYFLGEVNNPGVTSVKSGTTLLQAIAIGGGVTRFAAVKRIQLRRTNRQTGVQNVITLNYRALANGTASNAIELKDGDVILVPERRLFE